MLSHWHIPFPRVTLLFSKAGMAFVCRFMSSAPLGCFFLSYLSSAYVYGRSNALFASKPCVRWAISIWRCSNCTRRGDAQGMLIPCCYDMAALLCSSMVLACNAPVAVVWVAAVPRCDRVAGQLEKGSVLVVVGQGWKVSVMWSDACWQIPWLVEKQLRLTLIAGAFHTARGNTLEAAC